jgi:2-aminoadipate transaminase
MTTAKPAQTDPWADVYASRVESMRSSAVRDLFEAASRPDIISLSGGMPDIRELDLESVAEVAAAAVLQEGVAGLQYGDTQGRPQTKELIGQFMLDLDVHVTPNDLTVTTGGQQALDLLAKTFLNPGDLIITEGPTYLGALQAFSAYQPEVLSVEMDEQGMDTDLLEAELARLGGRKVKFLYTVPDFNNPAGVTMSLKRREHLIRLSHQYDFLIIEDDPYGRLRFEGEPVPRLRSLDDKVIYIGTVSKMFAPGLRTGWVIAPLPIRQKMNLVKQGTDLCGSALCQVIVEHYFNSTDWRSTLDRIIDRYHERRDALVAALEEHFPAGATWTHPHGGFFIWVTLPEYLKTSELLTMALDKGVTFVPGEGCYPAGSGKGSNSMRLAFCYETPEDSTEAIRRLAELVKEQMALAG